MASNNLKKFLEKQIQKIKEACGDSEQQALGWIKKYSKKFREDYIKEELLREALSDLEQLERNILDKRLEKISEINKEIENCKDKIKGSIELMEKNGNNNAK